MRRHGRVLAGQPERGVRARARLDRLFHDDEALVPVLAVRHHEVRRLLSQGGQPLGLLRHRSSAPVS